MYCNYHPNRIAVMQCRKCGKCLCEECAETTIDGLCKSCQNKTIEEEVKKSNENTQWYKQTLKYTLIVAGFLELLWFITDKEYRSWQLGFEFFYGFASIIVTFLYVKRILSSYSEEKPGCITNIIVYLISTIAAIMSIVLFIDLAMGLIKGKGFIPIDTHK